MAKKSAEELMKEAEEIQKKAVPELYPEDTTPAPVEDAPKTPPETAPEPPTEPTPLVTPPEPEPPKIDAEAELKRLQDENKKLQLELKKEESARLRLSDRDKKLNQAQSKIEELEKKFEKIETTVVKESPPTVDTTRAKLIDKYGEDSEAITMYDTLSLKVQSIEKSLKDELHKVNEKVGTVDKRSGEIAENTFLGDLTKDVSDWESIKAMPEFGEFLISNKIPYTNLTLYDALVNASTQHDSKTTASIYKAFKDTLTPPSPLPETPAKKDKEKLVAPATTPKGEVLTPTKEIYSREDIKTMKDKIFNHISKGDFKAAEAIQKKIDAYLDSLSFE